MFTRLLLGLLSGTMAYLFMASGWAADLAEIKQSLAGTTSRAAADAMDHLRRARAAPSKGMAGPSVSLWTP